MRAVGQGYDTGLAGMARDVGVSVDEEPPPPRRPLPRLRRLHLLPLPRAPLSLEKQRLVRLEKDLAQDPQLLSLVKTAGVSLEKRGLASTPRGWRSCSTSPRRCAGCTTRAPCSGSPSACCRSACASTTTARSTSSSSEPRRTTCRRAWGRRGTASSSTARLREYPLEYGTQYGAAMSAVRQHYFGSTGPRNQPHRDRVPVYAMFVTDGAPGDRPAPSSRCTAASYEPVFWQFMGIGKASSFAFLEKLDDLEGRYTDNADFFAVTPDELMGASPIPDDALFERMMTEYPDWLRARSGAGPPGLSVAAPRLVLLNGAPGIGKSTLARRWAAEAEGGVVVDPDELRRDLTGSPEETTRWARGQALATTAAHLGDGDDVVVPQLVARVSELERFEDVARTIGARFVHVLLVDAADDPVARFHRRDGADPWHDEVRAEVEAAGGDMVVEQYLAGSGRGAFRQDRPPRGPERRGRSGRHLGRPARRARAAHGYRRVRIALRPGRAPAQAGGAGGLDGLVEGVAPQRRGRGRGVRVVGTTGRRRASPSPRRPGRARVGRGSGCGGGGTAARGCRSWSGRRGTTRGRGGPRTATAGWCSRARRSRWSRAARAVCWAAVASRPIVSIASTRPAWSRTTRSMTASQAIRVSAPRPTRSPSVVTRGTRTLGAGELLRGGHDHDPRDGAGRRCRADGRRQPSWRRRGRLAAASAICTEASARR